MQLDCLFTSESVTEGNPDKVGDQISDGILDEILRQDSAGRVACETLVTTGLAFISAEISTDAYVEIPDIVRKTIKKIGYDDAAYGFEVSYPNDLVDVIYRWRHVGENYNPALGFVARRGVRLQELRSNYRPRPNFWHIRQMNYQLNFL